MAFQIVQQDITKLHVDAIVNAANNKLLRGGGVCGAIFHAAGIEQLTAACHEIGYCETGRAVITKGFDLPSRFIIHTVGPIWHGGQHHEEDILRSCYRESLKLAVKHRCQSIAFPLISAGIYGYPKREALTVAISTIKQFLFEEESDIDVTLVVYDRAIVALSEEFALDVQRYIDEHYVEFTRTLEERPFLEHVQSKSVQHSALKLQEQLLELDGELIQLEETFTQMLLRLIDERGLQDPDVYKRANISRKHFSKIRNDIDYNPTKKTVLAFAIALNLSIEETDRLLESAGYAFSNSRKFDVIIKYFIERNIYDVFKINEVLFYYEEQLLGV